MTFIYAVKTLENLLLMLGGNSDSGILNNYSDTEYFYQALDTISALVGSTTPAISKDEFYDIMMDENKKFSL